MESLDVRVLKDALLWHQSGYAVTLVTVVQTWGSAPRPPGALLALRDDGLVSGSVSGGCVEDDLIAQIHTQARDSNQPHAKWVDNKPSLLNYGVDAAQARSFGIPCGGTLRLLKEPLLDSAWLKELLTRTQNHELVERELHIQTGMVRLRPAQRGQRVQGVQFDGETLRSVFGPEWRLLLIGAGQLSQAVAQIARMMDFAVLVCDPREEYAPNAPTASWPGWAWLKGMPDDEVQALVPDAHTAIVALSHDPKLDDLALMEALRSKAFYVGALGSRRSQATRKQRLAEHFGLSESELARLHGPVGLAIAAKTPAEIAVSIMAEIIQAKNAI